MLINPPGDPFFTWMFAFSSAQSHVPLRTLCLYSTAPPTWSRCSGRPAAAPIPTLSKPLVTRSTNLAARRVHNPATSLTSSVASRTTSASLPLTASAMCHRVMLNRCMQVRKKHLGGLVVQQPQLCHIFTLNNAISTFLCTCSVPCVPQKVQARVDCQSGAVVTSWEPSKGSLTYTAVAQGSGGYASTCYSNDTTCLFNNLLCSLNYSITVWGSDKTCSSAGSSALKISTCKNYIYYISVAPTFSTCKAWALFTILYLISICLQCRVCHRKSELRLCALTPQARSHGKKKRACPTTQCKLLGLMVTRLSVTAAQPVVSYPACIVVSSTTWLWQLRTDGVTTATRIWHCSQVGLRCNKHSI